MTAYALAATWPRRIGQAWARIPGVIDGLLDGRLGSVDVELPGDHVAAVGRAPQDDERAHLDVEPGQVGQDSSVRNQHQGRTAPVRGDPLRDLDDLAPAALRVAE
jgi:hypothetical protein